MSKARRQRQPTEQPTDLPAARRQRPRIDAVGDVPPSSSVHDVRCSTGRKYHHVMLLARPAEGGRPYTGLISRLKAGDAAKSVTSSSFQPLRHWTQRRAGRCTITADGRTNVVWRNTSLAPFVVVVVSDASSPFE